jgi:hypothetical protein
MGDAGEGLVDNEARLQERMEEREAERRRKAGAAPPIDPERHREIESLQLARTSLQRQAETAQNPVRKQQLELAMAEIDRRLAELLPPPSA